MTKFNRIIITIAIVTCVVGTLFRHTYLYFGCIGILVSCIGVVIIFGGNDE